MPLKFNMPSKYASIANYGKNGLKTQGLKSNAVAVKERPKKRFSKKFPKLVEKRIRTLLADFEKNYAELIRSS
jgi:hypothetical protein